MLVRQPAVAGLFYPQDPEQLIAQLAEFLSNCRQPEPLSEAAHTRPPKAIIVPHAGYLYSGQVAAQAYSALQPVADKIRRVVLLGPAHRVYSERCTLPQSDHFATPLGQIQVDPQTFYRLSHHPLVAVSDHVHEQEHSLEVQLPFLQLCLVDFTLVPLVVGQVTPETVAAVLEMVWGEQDTLIVVSSDLSHYHTYHLAQTLDRETCESIEQCNHHLTGEQACGCVAINGLMLQARQRGLSPQLLTYKNSGDTAGSKAEVVGYASFALY